MAEIWGAVTAAVVGAGIAAATRPGAPDAPDYAAANREAIQADIDTLPLRRMIEQAARMGGTVLKDGYTQREVSADAAVTAAQQRLSELQNKLSSVQAEIPGAKDPAKPWQSQPATPNPEYAALQSQLTQARVDLETAIKNAGPNGQLTTQYYDKEGKPVSKADALLADFTGRGDIDLTRQMLDFQTESADKTAGSMLELQQKYGVAFVEQRLKELEAADPEGFALRKQLMAQVSDDLSKGTKLNDSMRAEVEQSTREAQAARGNILGSAPAAVEAMETGNAGYRLWQQRLANASAVLSGTTPVAQFGQISGAQQGASPYAASGVVAGTNINANAGAQGAQFAQQNYGIQTSQWSTQVANNPWASFFGGVSNTGMAIVGAKAWQGAGLPFGGG